MSRTIEVQYILKDEEGTEVARFQNIEDAKQYDRMLTAADEIFDLFNNIKELDNVKENPAVASSMAREGAGGTTLAGTLAVIYAYLVPMVVLPFFVMQRRVSSRASLIGRSFLVVS